MRILALRLGVAVTLFGVLGQLVFLVSAPRAVAPGEFGFPGYQVIFAVTYVVVAYLIATRRPTIVIGWSLLVAAAAIAVDGFAHEYALHAAAGTALPAAGLAIWIDAWAWAVNTGGLLFAVFRFPDGRPLSPRWAWIERLALVLVGAGLLLSALVPGPVLSSGLENPLGLSALAWIPPTFTNAPGIPATVLAVLSLAIRFRRSREVERQQLKWLVAAMVVVTAVAAVMVVLQAVLRDLPTAAFTVLALVTPAIPVSIGIAILRYRLYEIDVIVRRTLVYGALSVALVATYVVLVVVVQAALRPFTAGSELAVAGSTLATLAFAQPLRRRIQHVVDRRFYRSRYDAIRTVDLFAGRLRDRVDIDSVRTDLLGVVAEAVKPAHAGVWLRGR
jgi:hypothetical protein